jgi:hypothetical protein
VGVFNSNEQLVGCLRDLFARIESEDPGATETMLASGMCFYFRCSAPAAELVIDARQRPLHIGFSAPSQKPDLDIEITTEALHQILLGDLSLTKAMGSKQLKPNGPIWKVSKLADLFRHAQTLYPQVLRAHGIVK